ncbi:YicC/YloC family endoribonuclease [Dinoroseobacter sp. PD6]|uniref:YicC/YloC family endoribonuclease n=1 Tax=Dinoroseobacter sp. PD6 TaxID=3028384 RepID=UPI003084184D
MTGFATQEGSFEDWTWTWDIRAVNGRGLEVKVRLPDWLPGLDRAVRARIAKAAKRGNISVALRLNRAFGSGQSVNAEALDAVLRALSDLTLRADQAGVQLSPPNALDLLNFRGISETAPLSDEALSSLQAALLVDLDAALPAFVESREREGAATAAGLTEALDQVAGRLATARRLAEARRDTQASRLKAATAQILDAAGEGAPDPQRIAQELALLFVKADVTEELDRLDTHVSSACEILNADAPMGRKLDFLMQEFNREANTLCSKSADAALTQVGLDLKVLIDQMREQVQNLE